MTATYIKYIKPRSDKHFSMTGKQLAAAAAKGSKEARFEIERRRKNKQSR